MNTWHIVTSEYPPDVGGVSDYCGAIATGLAAAGDQVHVWCGSRLESTEAQHDAPASDAGSPTLESNGRVRLHPVLGRFAPGDLKNADRLLDSFPAPRRVLLQWVPHGFGYRSMNLAFCSWISKRAKRGDTIEVMVHEPFLAFWEGSLRQTAAALVHRVMTIMLIRAASRIWVSIPAWEKRWQPYALEKPVTFEWLPIPNTLPRPSCEAIRCARAQFAEPDGYLVGHFGTYGRVISEMLMDTLPTLLAISPRAHVRLFGSGSLSFHERFARQHSLLALRVKTAGYLPPTELAARIAACDLLLQPYPDGVSTRRTSAMAGLALGVPIATTRGHLTESLWAESACVALANGPGPLAMTASRLLDNQEARNLLKATGLAVYAERFDIARTITALRRVH